MHMLPTGKHVGTFQKYYFVDYKQQTDQSNFIFLQII